MWKAGPGRGAKVEGRKGLFVEQVGDVSCSH